LQMHVDAGAANFGSVAIPADDTCATATRTAVSVRLPCPVISLRPIDGLPCLRSYAKISSTIRKKTGGWESK
jgi:hypothetical protein